MTIIYHIYYWFKNDVEAGDYMPTAKIFANKEQALANIEACRAKQGDNFQLAIMTEKRAVNGEFCTFSEWRFE